MHAPADVFRPLYGDYLAVLVIGFALWFAYGVAFGNLALIIPNTIAFIVGSTTIAVARHYRK